MKIESIYSNILIDKVINYSKFLTSFQQDLMCPTFNISFYK